MSSEWKNRLLSEIVEINPKRTIKKGETTPFIDMAALPINSRDVNVAICSREYKGGGSKFQNGDTLVARITPCLENGKTALINCLSDNTIAHGSTEFIVLAARDQREFQFVYYLARSDPFRSYAIARMEGTSGRQRVPNIAVGDYEFFCPPADQRVAIGRFLANLDDRITLLRETNKALEAIAQAIFKSWFVDFDPVRAKMEGRQPGGMDEATAALFPDSFEESELGLVPKGWRVGTVQDLVVLQRGFDLPTVKRSKGKYPVIAASGPSGTHHTEMARGPGIITGRSGVLGKVFLTLEDYWPLNTTLWVKEFRLATPTFAYELLKTLDFHSLNAGSAVPTLNRNHVHSLPQILPDIKCVHNYEEIAMPLHKRAHQNSKQIALLEALRDTLLPRLISGQLRLPEAQEQIENA